MGDAGDSGVGVDGDGSPKPPPKSPRPPSLSVTASITLPLTFSIIASLLSYTTPTAPTTVIETTPLAIAIPFTIFCNIILTKTIYISYSLPSPIYA